MLSYVLQLIVITIGSDLWESSEAAQNDGTEGIEEDITEAINCYLLAIKIYLLHQRSAMAAQLYGEMGHALYALGMHCTLSCVLSLPFLCSLQ